MFTPRKKRVANGNVGVKIDRKRGRDICLWRTFEDAGGSREFTLYLSRDEFERLLDCGDELLSALEEEDDDAAAAAE